MTKCKCGHPMKQSGKHHYWWHVTDAPIHEQDIRGTVHCPYCDCPFPEPGEVM